jgi:dimethylaniline monooxygenase (N-oxide forming)
MRRDAAAVVPALDHARGRGRVCIVGAGSSGIAACQALQARGIPFDCFEAGSEVGGNWRYGNDNGMSAAYRSLHAKSSRKGMQYAAFPIPDDYPNYLSHAVVAKYLDDYVDHFGFRGSIRFQTNVVWIEPAWEGGWDVTTRRRHTAEERTERYAAVIVANGHHWAPKYPEPAFPGAGAFTGEQLHSHDYRTPEPYAGKRVLILGIGNSAADIATDCSQVAARTLIAVRRGAHIVPKYLLGTPIDHLTLMRLGTRTPRWFQRKAAATLVRVAQGKVTAYGLPKPDHKLLSMPPTVSDSLLSRVDHGDIMVTPTIDRFDRDRVHFADGSCEQVDVVIYCTGYRIRHPFLDEAAVLGVGVGSGEPRLYRRVVPPHLSGLYFIGLVQPLGAIMPIAEAQAQWVADLLEGRAALPHPARMIREIDRHRAVAARRYDRAAQPGIRVDFLPYLGEIRRERIAGAKRAQAASGGWLRSLSAIRFRASKARSASTTPIAPPRAPSGDASADRYVHASRDLSAQ